MTIPTTNNDLPSAIAKNITPHDTNTLEYYSRALYIGGTGNVTVVMNGVSVLFTGLPAGTILPIRTDKVMATGTTATSLVALY